MVDLCMSIFTSRRESVPLNGTPVGTSSWDKQAW